MHKHEGGAQTETGGVAVKRRAFTPSGGRATTYLKWTSYCIGLSSQPDGTAQSKVERAVGI